MLYDDLVKPGSYICHHGIKGQKWGIRRYQYSDGSLTELGRRRYAKTKSGMSQFSGIFREGRNAVLSEQHIDYNSITERYKDTIDFKEDRVRNDYLKNPKEAMSKQCSKVNPTYGKELGTTNNCTKCSMALLMSRMTGQDWEAGRSWDGKTDAFGYWTDGSKKHKADNLMDMSKLFALDMSEGSFGSLDIRSKSNPKNGHTIAWECNKNEHNVMEYTLHDSQIGKSYTGPTFTSVFNKFNSDANDNFDANNIMTIFDLTHATPNYDHLREDAVLRFDAGNTNASKLYDREWNRLYEGL